VCSSDLAARYALLCVAEAVPWPGRHRGTRAAALNPRPEISLANNGIGLADWFPVIGCPVIGREKAVPGCSLTAFSCTPTRISSHSWRPGQGSPPLK